MKSIHSKKRYLAFLLSLTMILTIIPFTNKELIKVNADTISGLSSINQISALTAAPIASLNWTAVASPVITGTPLSMDGSQIIVNFDMPMGTLGATKVAVDMANNGAIVDTKTVTTSITAASTTGSSITFSPTASGTYIFTATASRDGETAVKVSTSSSITFKLPHTSPVVEWKSITFGQSTNNVYHSVDVDNKTNNVTVTAGLKDGSQTFGKITGSHDGISYYYTEIDPTKNFDLSADIKVNFFAKTTADKQEGFGIMARDAIGTNLDTSTFSSNMVMVGGYSGLIQSVFRNNVVDSSGVGAKMEGVTKFGDRPANDGTATYKMRLKKTNTGYQTSVNNGTEKIYYRPKQLEILDSKKIYVGFFAARVASITVSNIDMKISDVATDPAGIPAPPEAVAPSINMTSLSASSTASYDLNLLANVKGKVVVSQAGAEIYNGPIVANTALVKNATLVSGDNTFDVVYMPDPAENITTSSAITPKYVVTYKSYGTVDGTVYVSQNGTPTATGTEKDPIDIYSAIKFVSAGQTIYVRGGNYNLTSPLTIEKSNDGTSDKPKILSAYPNETPIFNFGTKSSGIVLAANYWKIYGIDVTKANATGFRISGNYNTVERVNTYANGDTGLQISGSSSDTRDKWPTYNLVLNCVSHDNMDVAQNNADGFAAKLTCGVGNIFRGCISHNNCDDGWDLYSKLETGAIGAVTVENCIAYGNGTLSDGTKTKGDGNGFKLGGEGLAVKHVLRNSLSFNNNAAGITSNSDPAIIVENCTSVDNGKANYDFHYYTTATPDFTANNNISFRNAPGPADDSITLLVKDTNYFYNGTVSQNASAKQVSVSDFKSTTKPVLVSINTDGSFEIGNFMVLATTSTIQGGVKFTASEKDFTVNLTFDLSSLQPDKMLNGQAVVTNNKSSINSVLVIMVLYDENDRMVNMSYISKDIPIGDTEKLSTGFKLPSNITNYKVNMFVWDGTNLNNSIMQPIANIIELQ